MENKTETNCLVTFELPLDEFKFLCNMAMVVQKSPNELAKAIFERKCHEIAEKIYNNLPEFKDKDDGKAN